MVHLNRIYTRSGDTGETSLGDGTRVRKTHLRITAFGSVDELNSALGLALAVGNATQPVTNLQVQGTGKATQPVRSWLLQIQNDLFDLGADLCVPEKETYEYAPLRITAEQVSRLEHWIDDVNEKLQPLNSFILPGGSPAAAALHVARSICRRAETDVLRLADQEPINAQALIYLNRLSDLLFVLARGANDNGQSDILWQPGSEAGGKGEG